MNLPETLYSIHDPDATKDQIILTQICEYIKFLEGRIKKLEEQVLPKIESISPIQGSIKQHPQGDCGDPDCFECHDRERERRLYEQHQQMMMNPEYEGGW